MTTAQLDSAAVLAAARRDRAEADAAEARILGHALTWAHLHEVSADAYEAARFGNTPVLLAGPGAPAVAEFCVAELGAALGLTTDSARLLVSHTLELAHRLPLTWARVTDGSLRAWKARRIAEKTVSRVREAVAYVDAQVWSFAHKISPSATDRLVETAIGMYMPEYAEQTALASADARYVNVQHPLPGFGGTSTVVGELDLADAIDLDRALSAGAAELKDLGSDESLDVRRSIALGALARGELSLGFETGASAPSSTNGPLVACPEDGAQHRPLVEEGRPGPSRNPRTTHRDLTLYVHLSPDSPVAEIENAGRHVLSIEQIKTWCGTATTVTVKPVIDLDATITTNSYVPPAALREQVTLRDRTCVFPWCERNARRSDLDHIVEYDNGGPTSSPNLAPLCRRHHRLKTHSPWTYTQVEPGVFLWRSPHGYTFLRDPSGTRDLTPRPVEPPG